MKIAATKIRLLSVFCVTTFLISAQAKADPSPILKLTNEFAVKAVRFDPGYDYYYYSDRPGPLLGNELSLNNRQERLSYFREYLEKFKHTELDNNNSVDLDTAALFRSYLEDQIQYLENPAMALIDVSHLSNRLDAYSQMGLDLNSFPFEIRQDFENYLARADGIHQWVSDYQKLFLDMSAKGFHPSLRSLQMLIDNLQLAIPTDVTQSGFYHPIIIAEHKLSAEVVGNLKASYLAKISSTIYPEFKRMIAFLKDHLSEGSKYDGLYGSAEGQRLYDIYKNLSTDHYAGTPQEIHQLGLNEVARLEKEMKGLRAQLGYGQLSESEFNDRVRNDVGSYFTSEKDLLAAFRDAEKRVSTMIPSLFSNDPHVALEFRGIPDVKTPAGSYSGITDTIKTAYFNYNSANLHSVNRYKTHTLFLHEGIPGHHFQITTNYLLKSKIGNFRSDLYYSNTFMEGWALYAEHLGIEMGVYHTPELMIGHLSDEMLRAVRLVVDTGIHAKGWSRDKAVEYMAAHVMDDKTGVETEIDRYCVWPGQALGYKIGQLEILRLRKLAENTLGSRFDIRKYHEVVIGSGTISLPLLTQKVNAWIQTWVR